jgi:hemoglobin-like flavoprotein
MSDPKHPAQPPPPPNPSSTVSFGSGSMPVPAAIAPRPPAPQGSGSGAKGPLSPRTVELVQRSWAQVMPISDAAAGLFYDRLFEMDPSVRGLFKSDMAQQKKKLMQTLSIAVDGLSNPTKLIPVLEQLGIRHAGYMVQDHHYGLVGEALLWTLREGLGDSFTPETETSWKEVYGLVASVMQKAAATGGKAAPPVNTVRPPQPPVPPMQAAPPPVPSAPPVPMPQQAVRPPAPPPPPAPQQQQPQASAPAAKGPVSPRTVELVQRSWAQVMPISDAAASLFYDRLFELDPSVRPLFKSDMAQQKKKLMQTLSIAVDGLSNPTKLIPVLEQLGIRHAGYMVQDHHYGLVGEALLWTLREGLGDSFTSEIESAWKEVYGLVASVMKKAAASSPAPKPQARPPTPVPLAPAPPAPPAAAPSVEEEIELEVSMGLAPPPVAVPANGDQTIPYHLLAQSRLNNLPPYSPQAELGAPAAVAAPAAAVSIPVNIPREVTFNVNLNLKLEADPALKALGLRPQAPAPAERPAPVERPVPVERPMSAERQPPASSRGTVSPVVIVALCVLVSVSTVVALGPLGQAASSLSLTDWPRLAAPLFTLAALAVGYFWGRGRGSDRNR